MVPWLTMVNHGYDHGFHEQPWLNNGLTMIGDENHALDHGKLPWLTMVNHAHQNIHFRPWLSEVGHGQNVGNHA